MKRMKKIFWLLPLTAAVCMMPFAVRGARAASSAKNAAQNLDAPTTSNTTASSTRKANVAAQNARVARATDDFDNARPDRGETAWGRFVADALRDRTSADIALVNAGTLENGVLRAGDVQDGDIAALLSFGDDAVATIQLNGAQLRAALERAVGAFPTGSPAWLHLSGASAIFNPKAKSGARLQTLRVGGRDVENSDTFTVALPIGLAEGGSGYYKIWKGAPQNAGFSVLKTVVDYARSRRNISPDESARIRVS